MTAIGERLRRERQKRNLELDQISRELKISLKFLQAIEAEQFDRLPGVVFAKSFVRQYGRLLGLDEEELAAEVQRAMGPAPLVPQFDEQPKQSAPEIHVPRVEEWESANSKSSVLPALAGVVVVMLACSGVYAWWQHPRTKAPATEVAAVTPERQATPAESAPPAPSTAPPATAPTETASVANPSVPASTPATTPAATPASPPPAQPNADRSTTVPARVDPSSPGAAVTPARSAFPSQVTVPGARSNGPVRVELTADEPVWVLARTDGKYSFSGTLEAKQTRTVEANGTVMLRLGNAGGVSITLNGKPLGAVGPKGQVRTVQLTSSGFQIVVAPSPSVPLNDIL